MDPKLWSPPLLFPTFHPFYAPPHHPLSRAVVYQYHIYVYSQWVLWLHRVADPHCLHTLKRRPLLWPPPAPPPPSSSHQSLLAEELVVIADESSVSTSC